MCCYNIFFAKWHKKKEENEENKIKDRTSRQKVEGRKSKIKAFYVAHGSLKYVNKQSPQMWLEMFSQENMQVGLKYNKANHSIFVGHTTISILILAIYVDNIFITGSDVQHIIDAKKEVKFVIKDMRRPYTFLE